MTSITANARYLVRTTLNGSLYIFGSSDVILQLSSDFGSDGWDLVNPSSLARKGACTAYCIYTAPGIRKVLDTFKPWRV